MVVVGRIVCTAPPVSVVKVGAENVHSVTHININKVMSVLPAVVVNKCNTGGKILLKQYFCNAGFLYSTIIVLFRAMLLQ